MLYRKKWTSIQYANRYQINKHTLKDFKNAKNENYYFLNPEHF